MGWTKYTVTHDQLQAAGHTNSLLMFTVPPKGIVTDIIFKHSEAFAGSGITDYQMGVGDQSYQNRFVSMGPMTSAPSDNNYQQPGLVGIGMGSFASPTDVYLFAQSFGAGLDQSTQGSVDVWVNMDTLP